MSIEAGVLDIGVDSTRFAPGDTDSLLRSYLTLVRRTRDQRRAASITLRREDIEVIAGYLDQTVQTVLERLADLMGSTRTQRAAMLTLLATGAMLIAVTGSVAAEAPHSPANAAVESGRSVTLEVVDPYRADLNVLAAPPAATNDLAESADRSEVRPASSSPAAEVGEADIAAAVSAATQVEPLVLTGARANVGTPAHTDGDEVGVIAGDDGERVLVAVGLPPVPPAFDQPADEPPTDTIEPGETLEPRATTNSAPGSAIGTTDDGSTVAVGPPPIPPPPLADAPATGTTDDGSTVAVGAPPIPAPPLADAPTIDTTTG